jgi:AcrR family transcriptional regulator
MGRDRSLAGVAASPIPPAALQARSRRTRQSLIDAGFRLLEEQGPEGLTVGSVSALAGVAPGTVYRRFGDKDGLLSALQEEFTAGFRQEFGQRMEGRAAPGERSARESVDVAVRALADTFEAHERLLKVFVVVGMRDEHVLATGSRASHEGGRLFHDLLWPHRDRFTGADPEAAIDMAHRMIYASCMHRVLLGSNHESPTSLTWQQLADELSRAVALYLLGSLPTG